MIRWAKRGRVLEPGAFASWMTGRASMPIVERRDGGVLRIHFGSKDDAGRYVAGWADVDAGDPTRLLAVADRPALDVGPLGCFDDDGVLPAWIVAHGGHRYLYYIGWNRGKTPGMFRNSIGVAIGDGDGWLRLHPGPVVDRLPDEPHFTSTPCVLVEGGLWRLWYLSGIRWEMVDGTPEPLNNLRYAESDDGISWRRPGRVVVELERPGEGGLSRPCVVRDPDRYRMWYCHRDLVGYRTDPARSYRIGYAESPDGIQWQRRDDEAGIDVSMGEWDGEMICFPYVCDVDGRRLLFYNGNDFGATGIGYAEAR